MSSLWDFSVGFKILSTDSDSSTIRKTFSPKIKKSLSEKLTIKVNAWKYQHFTT